MIVKRDDRTFIVCEDGSETEVINSRKPELEKVHFIDDRGRLNYYSSGNFRGERHGKRICGVTTVRHTKMLSPKDREEYDSNPNEYMSSRVGGRYKLGV